MAFQKGQSGNKDGRPRGTVNRRTKLLRLLFEGEAEALGRRAIDMALAGDVPCLKLCLERILPALKDSPVCVQLPEIGDDATSVLAFSRAVIDNVTQGKITPLEGDLIMGMLEKYGRAINLHDLEGRISAMEETVRLQKLEKRR